MAQINTRIVLRNDSLANWELHSDVVLLKGEVGVAFDEQGVAKAKIGDGVKTWAELDWYGGDITNITNTTETIVQEIVGAPANEETGEEATGVFKDIEDIQESLGTPADTETGEEATGLYKDVEDLEEAIGTPADEEAGTEATGIYKDIEDLQEALGTPADAETGAEATGVYKELADIVNNKFNEVTDNGKIDTVIELIDYVEQHGEETAQIVSDITDLQALVGTVPVDEQIKALLGEQKAINDVIYEQVKYEIASAPEGTLVDYSDSEIRVMCPADTEWKLQQSGANANANLYYIGFRAYAPAGAVSFKEDLADKISDETMYSFEGNEFAGTDKYGRKYSVVWLPVASYDPASATWTYYGSMSSKEKYIGWYYSVEWYDADGKLINSDCIRVNLSNEDCHNNPAPYFMGGIIKEVAVNGVLCDVVNNRVDITVKNIVKDSDEIVVNEDGSMSIVKLDVSKLYDGDTTLVLNGGGAAM